MKAVKRAVVEYHKLSFGSAGKPLDGVGPEKVDEALQDGPAQLQQPAEEDREIIGMMEAALLRRALRRLRAQLENQGPRQSPIDPGRPTT